MKFKICIVVIAFGLSARAETSFALVTSNYVVTVIDRTPEYEMQGTNVTYIGVSRKTGKTITLTGRTDYSTAADGVSLGHFRGYVFKNKGFTYDVVCQAGWFLSVTDGKGKQSFVENGKVYY